MKFLIFFSRIFLFSSIIIFSYYKGYNDGGEEITNFCIEEIGALEEKIEEKIILEKVKSFNQGIDVAFERFFEQDNNKKLLQ